MANRKGNEVRKVCTVRLEPEEKAKIIKKFGSLRKALDFILKAINENNNSNNSNGMW